MPDPSESEHPRATFLRALHVERNAKAGFALGGLLAAFVFAWFVYVPDRRYSVVLWLMLAFVLAVGTGLLLTVAFTLGSAYRLVRGMDEADEDEFDGENGDQAT